MCVLAHAHVYTRTVAWVVLTRLQLQTESCVRCSGQGLKNTNNCAAGKSPEAQSNDDKAKGYSSLEPLKCLQSFTHRSMCTRFFLSVYRVSYSCAHGDAKISFLCAPAGQFQQHCHRRHFSRIRRTGKLRGSTCHLLNGPQHIRRAPALGVSPRLLPQLRERQVSVSLKDTGTQLKSIYPHVYLKKK